MHRTARPAEVSVPGLARDELQSHYQQTTGALMRISPPAAPPVENLGPCAGCKRFQRCVDGHLACSALALYLKGLPKPRWELAPRQDASQDRLLRILAPKAPPRPRRESAMRSIRVGDRWIRIGGFPKLTARARGTR